jgi:hypothetical protein
MGKVKSRLDPLRFPLRFLRLLSKGLIVLINLPIF